jgi:hypothetical protein
LVQNTVFTCMYLSTVFLACRTLASMPGQQKTVYLPECT